MYIGASKNHGIISNHWPYNRLRFGNQEKPCGHRQCSLEALKHLTFLRRAIFPYASELSKEHRHAFIDEQKIIAWKPNMVHNPSNP
jgi:hypothetical protein